MQNVDPSLTRVRADGVAGGLILVSMHRSAAATLLEARDTAGHRWTARLPDGRAVAVWLRGPRLALEMWDHYPKHCSACAERVPFTVPRATAVDSLPT